MLYKSIKTFNIKLLNRFLGGCFLKVKLSGLLCLVMILSLFGFAPITARAEQVNLEVLDRSKVEVTAGLKKSDFSKTDIKNMKNTDPNQMVRVIIELDQDSIIETATKSNQKVKGLGESKIKSLEKNIKTNQKNIKASLNKKIKTQDQVPGKKAAGESLSIAMNGFSTYVRFGDLAEARNTPGVASVIIANEYERPELFTSTGQVGADKAWLNEYKGEGTVVAIIDSGIDPSHKDFVITDVSRVALDKDDIEGMSELPGRYYTIKVPYAYNYYDLNDQIIDRGQDGQHGMHVAGTVAANGAIKGVAPEAQLLGMKVFSDDVLYATTFTDIYLKAIDDSIRLGADAINMSLGSPAGFYVVDSMEDAAINNARANGITVAISAGNERNTMQGSANFDDYLAVYTTNQSKNPDNGVVGSPSVNAGSLSVASFENIGLYTTALTITIGDTSANAMMLQATGSPDPFLRFGSQAVPVVFAGFGKTTDLQGMDLTGKIALISRGEISFVEKLANAVAVNAAGVIVFNNQGEDMVNMAGAEKATVPYVFIGQQAGEKMALASGGGQVVTVAFTDVLESLPNPQGNLLSNFSSWGATPGLRLKPEISAPGGMIYSTQNNNTYATMSGTSMAAPHVAGGAALVAQRINEDGLFRGISMSAKSNLVKTLLMNTAVPKQDKNGLYYDSRQQGAGMMNLGNALEATVTVTTPAGEPKIELLEFDQKKFKVKLTLKNYGTVDQVFKPETILLTDDYLSIGQKQYVSAERTQTVTHTTTAPREIVVPAKGSKNIEFTVDFAKGTGNDPTTQLTKNQFIGGFVRFGNSAIDLTVPILGFYGDWDEPNSLDEWAWNSLDNKSDNDPEFLFTQLLNSSEFGAWAAFQEKGEFYINPDSATSYKDFYGTDHLGLIGTMLRNAELMKFRITGANGKVLLEIGETQYARKIFRMLDGVDPYTLFGSSVWDGTINGMNLKEGTKLFYEIEIYRTLTSKPEVLRLPVYIDNLAPEVSAISYDSTQQILNVKATDKGSGMGSIYVQTDLGNNEYPYQSSGQQMSIDLSELDVKNSAYLYIEVLDNIYNYVPYYLEFPTSGPTPDPEPPVDETTDPITPDPPTPDAPTADTETKDPQVNQVEIKLLAPDLLEIYPKSVPFSGSVYGWNSLKEVNIAYQDQGITKVVELDLTKEMNGWSFMGNIDLPDGYHELRITAVNGDPDAVEKEFSIIRRFWVDSQKPTVTVTQRSPSKKKTEITLTATDNLNYIELYQGDPSDNDQDSFIGAKSLEDEGFGKLEVSLTKTLTFETKKGETVIMFYAVDGYGYKSEPIIVTIDPK